MTFCKLEKWKKNLHFTEKINYWNKITTIIAPQQLDPGSEGPQFYEFSGNFATIQLVLQQIYFRTISLLIRLGREGIGPDELGQLRIGREGTRQSITCKT